VGSENETLLRGPLRHSFDVVIQRVAIDYEDGRIQLSTAAVAANQMAMHHFVCHKVPAVPEYIFADPYRWFARISRGLT
jgi:hypothetical protein